MSMCPWLSLAGLLVLMAPALCSAQASSAQETSDSSATTVVTPAPSSSGFAWRFRPTLSAGVAFVDRGEKTPSVPDEPEMVVPLQLGLNIMMGSQGTRMPFVGGLVQVDMRGKGEYQVVPTLHLGFGIHGHDKKGEFETIPYVKFYGIMGLPMVDSQVGLHETLRVGLGLSSGYASVFGMATALKGLPLPGQFEWTMDMNQVTETTTHMFNFGWGF